MKPSVNTVAAPSPRAAAPIRTPALTLGDQTGSSGTYNLMSGGTLSVTGLGGEIVGNSGSGTFTQNGGINQVTATLYLGYSSNPGAGGTYNLSGGGELFVDEENIGYRGSGVFTQSGGTNSVTNNLYLGIQCRRQRHLLSERRPAS